MSDKEAPGAGPASSADDRAAVIIRVRFGTKNPFKAELEKTEDVEKLVGVVKTKYPDLEANYIWDEAKFVFMSNIKKRVPEEVIKKLMDEEYDVNVPDDKTIKGLTLCLLDGGKRMSYYSSSSGKGPVLPGDGSKLILHGDEDADHGVYVYAPLTAEAERVKEAEAAAVADAEAAVQKVKQAEAEAEAAVQKVKQAEAEAEAAVQKAKQAEAAVQKAKQAEADAEAAVQKAKQAEADAKAKMESAAHDQRDLLQAKFEKASADVFLAEARHAKAKAELVEASAQHREAAADRALTIAQLNEIEGATRKAQQNKKDAEVAAKQAKEDAALRDNKVTACNMLVAAVTALERARASGSEEWEKRAQQAHQAALQEVMKASDAIHRSLATLDSILNHPALKEFLKRDRHVFNPVVTVSPFSSLVGIEGSMQASYKLLNTHLNFDKVIPINPQTGKRDIDKSKLPLVTFSGGPGSGKSTFLTELAKGRAIDQAPETVRALWKHVFPVTVTFNFKSQLSASWKADQNISNAVATRIFASYFFAPEAFNTFMGTISANEFLLQRFFTVQSVVQFIIDDIRKQDPNGMLLLLVDELLKLNDFAVNGCQPASASIPPPSELRKTLSVALDDLTSALETFAEQKAFWLVVSSLSREPLGLYSSTSSRVIDYIPPSVLNIRDRAIFDALFKDTPMAYEPDVMEAIFDTGGYPKYLAACKLSLKENPASDVSVVLSDIHASCRKTAVGDLSLKLVLLALAGRRFRYNDHHDFGLGSSTSLAILTARGVLCNALETTGAFVPFISPFRLLNFCTGLSSVDPEMLMERLITRIFSLRTNFHATLFEQFHMLMDAIKRLAVMRLRKLEGAVVHESLSMQEFYEGVCMKSTDKDHFVIDLTLPVVIHDQLTVRFLDLKHLEGIEKAGVHYFLCVAGQPGFDMVIVQHHHDGRLQVLFVETKHSASDATTTLGLTEVKNKHKLAQDQAAPWLRHITRTQRGGTIGTMLLVVAWRDITQNALDDKQLPSGVAVLPKKALEDFYTPSMLFKGVFFRSLKGDPDVREKKSVGAVVSEMLVAILNEGLVQLFH